MLPLMILIPVIGVAGALAKGVISACSDSSSSSSSSSSSATTAAAAAAEARRRNRQNLFGETVRCAHRHLDETLAETAKDFQLLEAAPKGAAPKPVSGVIASTLLAGWEAYVAAAMAESAVVPLGKIRVTRDDICQRLFNTTAAVNAEAIDAAIQWLRNDPDGLWKMIAKEPLENLTLRQQAIEEEVKGLKQLIHAWQNTVDKELS